jgi:hypothetical protein
VSAAKVEALKESRMNVIMKRAGKAVVLVIGTLLVGGLVGEGLDHFKNYSYYDPKDYFARALDIAELVIIMTWSAIGMWQLNKRLPFRFIAWGVAALLSGLIVLIAIHG